MARTDENLALAETQLGDVAPDRRDPLVGRVLDGKYELLRKLGEGGMGTVYEGLHRRIGRRVAVKLLHPRLANDPTIFARFEGEARAATATGHPHIVQVTDMGELDDGTAYLVLELLDGRELREEMARGPLRVARMVRIALQICGALEAVHAAGIVHRDLKPSNIFLVRHLDDPDFVKVLDFGIAKLTRPDGEAPELRTSTGVAIGTPIYMSPEQARGRRDVDHRTDVYALGIILFEALTGRCPFVGASLPDLLVKICHEPAPRLRELRPDLPDALEAVISRAIAKDTAERTPSARALADARMVRIALQICGALADALEPFASFDELPFAATQQASIAVAEPAAIRARRGPWPMVVAGVVGAAALGAVAFVALRPAETTPDPTPTSAVSREPASPAAAAVTVESVPAGALIRVDGEPMGNEPFTLQLEPGSTHQLMVEREGYVTLRETRRVGQAAETWRVVLEPVASPGPAAENVDPQRGGGRRAGERRGGASRREPAVAASTATPSRGPTPESAPTTPVGPSPPPDTTQGSAVEPRPARERGLTFTP